MEKFLDVIKWILIIVVIVMIGGGISNLTSCSFNDKDGMRDVKAYTQYCRVVLTDKDGTTVYYDSGEYDEKRNEYVFLTGNYNVSKLSDVVPVDSVAKITVTPSENYEIKKISVTIDGQKLNTELEKLVTSGDMIDVKGNVEIWAECVIKQRSFLITTNNEQLLNDYLSLTIYQNDQQKTWDTKFDLGSDVMIVYSTWFLTQNRYILNSVKINDVIVDFTVIDKDSEIDLNYYNYKIQEENNIYIEFSDERIPQYQIKVTSNDSEKLADLHFVAVHNGDKTEVLPTDYKFTEGTEVVLVYSIMGDYLVNKVLINDVETIFTPHPNTSYQSYFSTIITSDLNIYIEFSDELIPQYQIKVTSNDSEKLADLHFVAIYNDNKTEVLPTNLMFNEGTEVILVYTIMGDYTVDRVLINDAEVTFTPNENTSYQSYFSTIITSDLNIYVEFAEDCSVTLTSNDNTKFEIAHSYVYYNDSSHGMPGTIIVPNGSEIIIAYATFNKIKVNRVLINNVEVEFELLDTTYFQYFHTMTVNNDIEIFIEFDILITSVTINNKDCFELMCDVYYTTQTPVSADCDWELLRYQQNNTQVVVENVRFISFKVYTGGTGVFMIKKSTGEPICCLNFKNAGTQYTQAFCVDDITDFYIEFIY